MPFDRRGFLSLSVGAAAGAVLPRIASPQDERARASRPNIIFILADDLGYGDLGCYGQKQIQTPNLDCIAIEGIRFTDCYAGSTVCAPSRCCLMTGRHTGRCLVRGNALIPLRPEDVTVAEVLKAAGYATGIIGKWGLGEPETTGIPNRKGFDEWFGYLNQGHAHNYYPGYLWKNKEKFILEGNQDGRKGQYSHDLFTAEAIGFIRRHKNNPFFLYLAYTIPHANNELGGKTGNGMEVPSYAPYDDKPWPAPQKGHAAMITRLDRDIGQIFALLKELRIDEKTIVFFSSDNGPHCEGGATPDFFDSNGPLRGIKRDLYEGGIRVPMIVRWPGRIKAGTVSNQVWAFWDFLPTAAELAGAKPPDGIDGISMLPALLGKQQKQHDYLYWEFHERGTAMAVRMGKWKAVRPLPKTPIELYDIEKDIGEEHNVADQHPDVAASAAEIFGTERTESDYFPLREYPPKRNKKKKPKQGR
ncbi:MAG: arylsulfatase [Planctomycetota bacterium]